MQAQISKTPVTDIHGHPDIRPITRENRVKSISKLANGDMQCTQNNGNVFVIKAKDDVLQAFVVFTMMHADDCCE